MVAGRTCHVICQSHIDMAWLWRWQETIGFIRDTFEAEVDLFEAHPDYTFSQSQLIAYMAVQERFPELFEKVKRLVAEGRWEVVGGELVESDHVILGGESLVRQFLYGQLYARRELGVQATVGWSPDSFGHCGSLPQILRKCGLDSFVYKRPMAGEQDVPVTPFWWEGIDGSRVLAYRTTNKGWDFVNPIPPELAERHKLHQTWGYSGTGDQGGVRPYKELGEDEHGKHVYSSPSRYFAAVRAEVVDLPVVRGELNYTYEGTYTTRARVKQWNRQCEGMLYLAESIAAAAWLEGVPYPHAELAEAWRLLAFNQFHDILPGTSIPEVYEDAERDYWQIALLTAQVFAHSTEVFVEPADDVTAAYNPLPFARLSDGHDLDYRLASLPACSFGALERTDSLQTGRSDRELLLDNGILRVEVDPQTGWISQVTDLRTGREVLAAPGGNVLTLWKEDSFENASAAEWNAWDIGVSDRGEPATVHARPELVDVERGTRGIRCYHTWGDSFSDTTLWLEPDSDSVEIRIDPYWRERLVLLRTEFTLNVSPEAEAWHEIPYGAVKRENNGAEVPSYRWVDLSDSSGGAALVNDSRCGHSVLGNTIRMTLLRCATNPDPVSDSGWFTFHYRFCPHEGTWRDADVPARAYELNTPSWDVQGRPVRQPRLPKIEGKGIHLGACKVSEDGRFVVMRLVESFGLASTGRVLCGEVFRSAHEANLLEDIERDLEIVDGALDLAFTPFEIKTVLLEPQRTPTRG